MVGRGNKVKLEKAAMNHKPYSQFDSDDLILRDHLAIERTRLANERTLLAYLRSGVAMLMVSGSQRHPQTTSIKRANACLMLSLSV